MGDRHAIWGKTPADLKNIEPDEPKLNNSVNEPEANPAKYGEVMLLRDNMPCIADKPLFDQSVATRHKNSSLLFASLSLATFKANKQIPFKCLIGTFYLLTTSQSRP